jgi:kynurenine formamidase
MNRREDVPSFAELLVRTDAPAGSAWGIFGENDQLGTVNFLTAERVLDAKACIRAGKFFNLDCPLDAFDPPILAHRKSMKHSIFGSSPHHRDDCIDSFYLQSGSQVDGLRHFRHPLHGFYNRASDSSIVPNNPTLGVNRMAEHGIVGRGVLIDIERHLAQQKRRLNYAANDPISVQLIDEAAAAQGVAFHTGDILLLRTGWLKYYFEMSHSERSAFPQSMCSPGLAQSYETLAWIWDHQFSVCACDNFGLECFPPLPDSPFKLEVKSVPDVHPRHAGMMHASMIAMLGLTIGEQWNLEDLAADCADSGVWECFVAAKPLNLVGGVGSPANAFALK